MREGSYVMCRTLFGIALLFCACQRQEGAFKRACGSLNTKLCSKICASQPYQLSLHGDRLRASKGAAQLEVHERHWL